MSIIPNWHPLFVHFPIALLITAAAFFIAALFWRRKPLGAKLYQAGLYNLWLGAFAALMTVATGWYAYQTVKHDEAGHLAMTIHLHWAFATLALSVLTVCITIFKRYRNRPTVLVPALSLLCAGAVSVTAYLGGENVFRNGIGVMRMPSTEYHHNQMDMEGVEHDHRHE